MSLTCMAIFQNGPTPYCWIACLLVVTISFHKPGVVMGDTDEMIALMMLKGNLTDPNRALQGWDREFFNPCTFNHITCNPGNHVVRIELGEQGLSGSLVPELAFLTNLQYLEFYKNNLSGPIPPELGGLENLISLDIYDNNFSGPIPESLGNLSSLRILGANNNSLSGTIPTSLTNLANLQQLLLGFNELTGEVPSNGSFALFTLTSFEGNSGLCGPIIGVPCPGEAPFANPTIDSSSSSSFARRSRHKWDAWLWAMLVATLTFGFATITTHPWLDMLIQNPRPS